MLLAYHNFATMRTNRDPFRAAGTAKRHHRQEKLENWNDALQSARMYHSKAMRRTQLQQQIATNSSKLLEDPESNLSSLRALLELTLDEDSVVRTITSLAVYTYLSRSQDFCTLPGTAQNRSSELCEAGFGSMMHMTTL